MLAGMHTFYPFHTGERLLLHMASETHKVAAREYASGAGGLSVCEVKFAPALASFERMSARCSAGSSAWVARVATRRLYADTILHGPAGAGMVRLCPPAAKRPTSQSACMLL